jgi:hypothetical protein
VTRPRFGAAALLVVAAVVVAFAGLVAAVMVLQPVHSFH